jgi:gas vesicle protein
MQLQPVSSLLTTNPWPSSPTYKNPLQTLSDGSNKNLSSNTSATSLLNATIESESYSKQTLDIEFTSKDGDKVSLSLESLQYQKTMLQVDVSGSPDDMNKIIDFLKQQFKSMKEELIKSFIESQGGKVDDTTTPAQVDKTQATAVPEYWNAENTSQRIVDFATQFLDAFKGSGEEFLTAIKNAIDDGFKQAKDLLGDLPDKVNTLVSDTYDLVMQKLDKWAESKGIAVSQPETAAA